MGLKNIPAVDEILAQKPVTKLIEKYNREFVVQLVRRTLDQQRKEIRASWQSLERAQILKEVVGKLGRLAEEASQGTLVRVINATGVVLHTNLGRAPLGNRALHYMQEMAGTYNNLEMDLERGERGSRYTHVEALLQELTGAEAEAGRPRHAEAEQAPCNVQRQAPSRRRRRLEPWPGSAGPRILPSLLEHSYGLRLA